MRFRPRLGSLRRTTASLFCGLAVCVAIAYCVALGSGYRFFIEMSGSMRPILSTGALIVSKPEPGASAHVGQIVTFVAPDHSGRLITHRLHSIVRAHGKVGFRTKGDANPSVDAWTVQFPRQVGVEQFSIPLVGYAFHELDERFIRLLLVAMIAATFGSVLMGRIWRSELDAILVRRRTRRASPAA